MQTRSGRRGDGFIPPETRPVPPRIKQKEKCMPKGIIDRPDTLGDPTGTGEAKVVGVRSGNNAPDKMDSTLKDEDWGKPSPARNRPLRPAAGY